MGNFIQHESCPKCGSSDANALYDDGSKTCWSCNAFTPAPSDGVKPIKSEKKGKNNPAAMLEILKLPHPAIPDRGIRQETCEYFGVRAEINSYSGGPDKTYFPYGSGSKLSAFKVKTPDKSTWIVGDFSDVKLFGQNKCRKGGKLLLITEGEEDCMIAFQMLKDNHPNGVGYNVTSIQSGAKKDGSVAKELVGQIEFMERFDKVVICFDQDEVGIEYAQALGAILTPGKARVMSFSEKDACDMWRSGKSEEFIHAFNNPEVVKSEGVISGADISDDELLKPIEPGFVLPFPKLNAMVHGARTNELIIVTGASGLGKTTFAREIAYSMILDPEERVANVMLEEGHIKTAQGYIAMDNNIPLGLFRENPGILAKDKYHASKKKMVDNGRTMFYRHCGSMQSDTLIEKLKYFRFAHGCKRVVLDHISLVVSGRESSREGERKDIDILMTKLFSFVETYDVTVISIVHLSRNGSKKSFNEGAPVSLNDLRGSAALEQLSHGVWAIEGNQQGLEPNKRQIRILKAREFGQLGLADECMYNSTTGRMTAITTPQPGEDGTTYDF